MDNLILDITEKHRIWLESQGKNGEPLFLTEQNLTGLNLSGIDLTQAVLLGINFDFATMNNTCLDCANLGYSSFRKAELNSLSLIKAEANHTFFEAAILCNGNAFRTTFIGACFKEADLRGMNFSDSLLSNADFSGAKINGCKFYNVNFTNVQGMETAQFDWIEVKEHGNITRIRSYDEIIKLNISSQMLD
jgi:uncharacterized protein YjbI with pentapeptide repeats